MQQATEYPILPSFTALAPTDRLLGLKTCQLEDGVGRPTCLEPDGSAWEVVDVGSLREGLASGLGGLAGKTYTRKLKFDVDVVVLPKAIWKEIVRGTHQSSFCSCRHTFAAISSQFRRPVGTLHQPRRLPGLLPSTLRLRHFSFCLVVVVAQCCSTASLRFVIFRRHRIQPKLPLLTRSFSAALIV